VTPEDLNEFLRREFPSTARQGFRCEALADGEALIRWPLDESELRPGGYIPGPTQFAISDLALWFGVFTKIGVEPMAVTSDMTITFLRPAVGGDLLARSRIVRVGSARIYGQVDVWVDGAPDRLTAHAIGHYSNPTGDKP
jgi:uncharacterized protein (TIGR00369 family)